MLFTVRALSPDRQVRELTLEAADGADARRLARSQGLFVTDVQAAGLSRWRHARLPLSLVLFSQELLALLEAGLGIVEAFEALQEKEQQTELRALFGRLLAALHEGRRLSVAMSEHPGFFPPLYLGVLRAAEGTSDLPRALRRYIEYQGRLDALKAKVSGAAIYPAILLSVGTAVSLFLIVYVVPRFAEVYQGAGRSLPWMSELLLNWGRWAGGHLAVIAAAGVLAGAAAVSLVRSGRLLAWLLEGLQRLPGPGEKLAMYQLSRIYLTLGMLLDGGIPVLAALQTARQVTTPAYAYRLQLAAAEIQGGQPVSESFARHGLTTGISLRLLLVGERTGDLAGMLARCAAFYDGEITRWMDRFMRAFEPLLMAAIGLVVGVLVLLLYMPIFDLAGNF